MNQNTKMLIGAIIAAALAIAVYYGAISQQTANSIQGQAGQALGTAPAQQSTGTTPQANPPTGAPAPQTTAPETTTPQPAPAPTTPH